MSASQPYPDAFNAVFPAQLTDATLVSGVWCYDFLEQSYNADDGTFVDANPGRSGVAAQSPAVEVNNQLVFILPCYVWLRFSTVASGAPRYEFDAGQPGGTVVETATDFTVTGAMNGYLIDCDCSANDIAVSLQVAPYPKDYFTVYIRRADSTGPIAATQYALTVHSGTSMGTLFAALPIGRTVLQAQVINGVWQFRFWQMRQPEGGTPYNVDYVTDGIQRFLGYASGAGYRGSYGYGQTENRCVAVNTVAAASVTFTTTLSPSDSAATSYAGAATVFTTAGTAGNSTWTLTGNGSAALSASGPASITLSSGTGGNVVVISAITSGVGVTTSLAGATGQNGTDIIGNQYVAGWMFSFGTWTPASADWAGDPTTLGEAVNRLASAVAGLLGNPIP